MTSTYDRLLLSAASNKSVSKPINRTCEAYGCNNIATNQVTVNVGNQGNIELDVCKRCLPKFNAETSRVVTSSRRNHSLLALNEYEEHQDSPDRRLEILQSSESRRP
jgi:hypothetical protein